MNQAPAVGQIRSKRSMLLSIAAVAIIIVAATWYVGGSQGFSSIGRGGQNLKLLPRVGEVAPDVVLVLSDGRIGKLSDFRGQPVWLNFWGSWCPPCRAEMPDLVAAYKQLQPRGLQLIAISLDEPMEDAVRYAQRNGATYLVAGDPERRLTGQAYPILNFPTHILIDRDGIVRDIALTLLSEEEMLARAEKILAPVDTST